MNSYVTKLVFRIIGGNGNHPAQFDEQLRLIKADSEQMAYHKADKLGNEVENNFINADAQAVKWEFVGVTEVNLLNDLTDGAELYYQIQEAPNADLYIAWAQHKATLLSLQV